MKQIDMTDDMKVDEQIKETQKALGGEPIPNPPTGANTTGEGVGEPDRSREAVEDFDNYKTLVERLNVEEYHYVFDLANALDLARSETSTLQARNIRLEAELDVIATEVASDEALKQAVARYIKAEAKIDGFEADPKHLKSGPAQALANSKTRESLLREENEKLKAVIEAGKKLIPNDPFVEYAHFRPATCQFCHYNHPEHTNLCEYVKYRKKCKEVL